MFQLEEIIRENIKKLKPYSSARDEFKGKAEIYLDANENSLGSPLRKSYERYPDPHQEQVKAALSEIKGIPAPNIFLGNGSDECIDLLYRCFCEPGKSNVVICPPTYGMYEVYAAVNDVDVQNVPLVGSFAVDVDSILKAVNENTRLIWLCSPNNPTGNSIPVNNIKRLLKNANALVVVDEAYIDFSGQHSLISDLKDYPNLVVLQTFSKAWGLAGLRLGMAFASEEIISCLTKVKPPYNISQETQELALEAMRNLELKERKVSGLIMLREQLANALTALSAVELVYPSDANFLLVKVKDANRIYSELLAKGIVTRNRSLQPGCENCLRITVGTAVENAALIDALNNNTSRIGLLERKTNETRVAIQLNLNGTGLANIQTGLNFFDHMLDQLARHGMVDLVVRVDGDLEVDEHHTIEDTAISLGEAFAKAIGDKRGMERYGFALPMDDAEAKVLIDFGGRSWLVWKVEFNREKIGDVPTEMFYHFFKSFSDAAKCNLNIEANGSNEHHKIEAIFKAFAKAVKMAVKKDPFSNYLPSTKGVL